MKLLIINYKIYAHFTRNRAMVAFLKFSLLYEIINFEINVEAEDVYSRIIRTKMIYSDQLTH